MFTVKYIETTKFILEYFNVEHQKNSWNLIIIYYLLGIFPQ